MDGQEVDTGTFQATIRKDVEYVRYVPDKDKEFKIMLWEEELRKEQNKDLVTDDWSMYDDQYPRIGPIVFISGEDPSSTDKNN